MPLVLVVEDRPTDREILVALLDNSGYELLESETAEEAVRLALEWKPDLVLADMLVPEMDGLDLARAVRANPAIAQTPIMLYTASDELFELERLAHAAGVSLVLRKPADPREVLRAVESLVDSTATS